MITFKHMEHDKWEPKYLTWALIFVNFYVNYCCLNVQPVQIRHFNHVVRMIIRNEHLQK